VLRVGYDLTGIALDQGGGARIAEGMRAALAGRVELRELRAPGFGGRIARGLVRELWWNTAGVARAARGCDVLHCPLPVAPLAGAVPTIVTIHDALIFERPEWFTRANALHARTWLRRAARRAAFVHTTSEHSRAALARHLGVAPERIAVIAPGVDERFTPGERGDGGYVLTVGTLQPRKNVEAAIAAAEALGVRLVIAGGRGWRDEALVERVRGSRAQVELAGRVSDDELVALYRGADTFVFPSLGEGFGLPPLEAMACGTPVVCSAATSLPEVVGDAAVLFDPADPDALTRELGALLADDGRRAALRAAGLARAAEFSWARCADALLALYTRTAR
jgi:alpha-1,3-rhamnosyl/mannosyltransferase